MDTMEQQDNLSRQEPNSNVKLVVSLLLMVLLMAGGYLIAVKLIESREEPKRGKPPVAKLSVEAVRVSPSDYTISVVSHGTVSPGVEGTLIPEVPGRIVEMSPRLIDGGSFTKGEVLLRIEEHDYRLAIPKAEAQLAAARLSLAEEKARSAQALRDWLRFNKEEAGDELALRKPQLAKARADLAAAEAALELAELNLQRTAITAPYNGKVLSKSVSVGQYVGPGTVLAKIYGVDYFEVNLPLTSEQLQYLTIPEVADDPTAPGQGMEVALFADVGNKRLQYRGTIVRGQGVIDVKSRQLSVVARVDDPLRLTRSEESPEINSVDLRDLESSKSAPYVPSPLTGEGQDGGENSHVPQPLLKSTTLPLEPGRFVEARLSGETLRNVFVVPRSAVKEGTRILVVDAENKLHQRQIEVLHADRENAVIKEGLSPGELVCVSPVVFDGKPIEVRVRVLGEEPPKESGPPSPKAKGAGKKEEATSPPRSAQ